MGKQIASCFTGRKDGGEGKEEGKEGEVRKGQRREEGWEEKEQLHNNNGHRQYG